MAKDTYISPLLKSAMAKKAGGGSFPPPSPPLAKKSHKVLPPVKKLTDTFTTNSGKVMTRRQLSNLVAKANYKAKQAKAYMSEKEYKNFIKQFEKGIAGTGAYEKGAKSYTLKGITKHRKLRAIEAAARKALESKYMSRKKYKQIDEKRFQKFEDKGFNRKQYDLLQRLFQTPTWNKLRDYGIIDSDQFLASLKDDVFAQGLEDDETIDKLKDILDDYDTAEIYKEWGKEATADPYKVEPVDANTPEASNAWDDLTKETYKTPDKGNFGDFMKELASDSTDDTTSGEVSIKLIDKLLDAMK